MIDHGMRTALNFLSRCLHSFIMLYLRIIVRTFICYFFSYFNCRRLKLKLLLKIYLSIQLGTRSLYGVCSRGRGGNKQSN